MRPRSLVLSLLATALLLPALAAGASAAGTTPANPAGAAAKRVCATPSPLMAECSAYIRTTPAADPLAAPAGYGPADLQAAYALARSDSPTATIGIVDAFDDPNAESDLAAYRSKFGLPACTTANGCFRKVDQKGGKRYPPTDTGWAAEISLDLDMVSAVCPTCHILLVEAMNNGIKNLSYAVDTAVNLGAVAVSNSYGAPESATAAGTSINSHFNHPGVAITASTGDSGYAVGFPAASQYVVAVGGTTLNRDAAGAFTETAWSGAGSGCSAYFPKPAWQTTATGCAKRAVADVSAVADPKTGVAVYDTFGYGGWLVFGGTSAASPIIATVYGASHNAGSYPAQWTWGHPAGLYDVTSGSNGTCATSQWCTASSGWDGPTGLGSPRGVSAFSTTP